METGNMRCEPKQAVYNKFNELICLLVSSVPYLLKTRRERKDVSHGMREREKRKKGKNHARKQRR
jgi:hypothetical protein